MVKKQRNPHFPPPKDVDKEKLYQIYLNLPNDRRSLRAAAEAWNKQCPDPANHITLPYVQNVSRKNGWRSRLLADLGPQGVKGIAGLHTLRMGIMWKEIEQDMAHLSVEFMKSIEGKMLHKVKTELDSIKLDSTDKMEHMLDIILKLTEIEHRIRGMSIDERDQEDDKKKPRNVSPDWLDIVNAGPVKPN